MGRICSSEDEQQHSRCGARLCHGSCHQGCRRCWQHPAHGGEGQEKPGQEDVSQGNKVIALGASLGQMPVPKGRTWDLKPFLLGKVKITVWLAISKASGTFQAQNCCQLQSWSQRTKLNSNDPNRTKCCREAFPNFSCLLPPLVWHIQTDDSTLIFLNVQIILVQCPLSLKSHRAHHGH